MKAVWVLCIIFIVAGWSAPPPARADYHYASHEGSNEYPYTSWATGADVIQDAVDAASARDTVYIGAGEYNEFIRIPDSTTHIGFIGAGQDSTYIWVDTTQGVHLMNVSDSTFVKGIHFEHRGLGIKSTIFASWHEHIEVRECLFSGGLEYIGVTSINGGLVVENCIFQGPLESAISNWFSCEAPHVIIRNNLVINSGSEAFIFCGKKVIVENNIGNTLYSGVIRQALGPVDTLIVTNNITFESVRAVALVIEEDSIVINNNTSYNDSYINIRAQPAYDLYHPTATSKLYNNTITSEGIGIRFNYPEPDDWIDLRFNNLKNDTADIVFYNGIGLVDTSIIYHESPMFVGSGDYHLQAFSPLIDAGHPDIFDVDGTISDIGAYGGPRGEYYEYLDLPPLTPGDIEFQVDNDTVFFQWVMNEEADFNRYQVYRDTVSGFEPNVFNMIAEPEISIFIDTTFDPVFNYFYLFSSIDNQNNQSEYSEEIHISMTGIEDETGSDIPRITAISANYPNPFNTSTKIAYYVGNLGPVPAQIKIEIFDILGRKVRTLVNEKKEVGSHVVIWDGKGDKGDDLQSGVYFARISQWDTPVLTKTQKIMLLK